MVATVTVQTAAHLATMNAHAVPPAAMAAVTVLHLRPQHLRNALLAAMEIVQTVAWQASHLKIVDPLATMAVAILNHSLAIVTAIKHATAPQTRPSAFAVMHRMIVAAWAVANVTTYATTVIRRHCRLPHQLLCKSLS